MLTGIKEVDNKIFQYLDSNTLKMIYYINRYSNNLLKDNQFWLNKFNCDNLPILDNVPSFQEYIKIDNCKRYAEKIIIVNDMESHRENNTTSGEIIIEFHINDVLHYQEDNRTYNDTFMKFSNNYDRLFKLLPDHIDDFNPFIEKDASYYIDIFIKEKNGYKIVRVLFYNYDTGIEKCFDYIIDYENILQLLTRALYYRNISIESYDDNGISFIIKDFALFNDYINNRKRCSNDDKIIAYQRAALFQFLDYSCEDIIKMYLNRIKNKIK